MILQVQNNYNGTGLGTNSNTRIGSKAETIKAIIVKKTFMYISTILYCMVYIAIII